MSARLSAAAGIGASYSSKGGGAIGVTGSASASRGREDGEGVTQRNTHVNAGNLLTMQSGGDTNLKGAVVSGRQVMADIGGNLNIESLQDTAVFDYKSQNLSASATVGYGVSVSVSASQSKIKNDYASVQEQSGILAGDGGFDIRVKGDTDLKGAVIASTQAAVDENRNQLVTATLTHSDIQNHADASTDSVGIAVSTSFGKSADGKENRNLTNSKYEAGKAVIGNLLNNGSESRSASSTTRSAIGAGEVVIANEDGQKEKTGKTASQTIASLNRDTVSTNTVLHKQDTDEMMAEAQIRQAFKQAVFQEATKLTDESYRRMFVEKTVVYEVTKDEQGNIHKRALSDEEKLNLKAGTDGKIHIANNGIFNDSAAASKYANQHSTAVEGPQYLIYFPEADNKASELMVAGYQKFLENDFFGLTNASEENKKMMQQYGQQGLQLDGHSRGSLTIGSALESLDRQPENQGILSKTNVHFFGPAYSANTADGLLSNLQNREAITDLEKKNEMVLRMQNHNADPVGGYFVVGNNPGTGGTIPEGSNSMKEAINALGGDFTVHNCYGNSTNDECRKFWNDSLGNRPQSKPVRTYKKE